MNYSMQDDSEAHWQACQTPQSCKPSCIWLTSICQRSQDFLKAKDAATHPNRLFGWL